ncbi:hypothetical protein B0H21DRAFT_159450 [Amylocystis lapponica]|nr:hypothetical protein B0H21DRAFT_159450 [Amylocystis lapponica]
MVNSPDGPTSIDEVIPSLHDAVLSTVIIWASRGGRVAHWRTSYTFKTVKLGYIGMSLDMFQPEIHQYQTTGTNQFGCLRIRATRDKLHSRNYAVLEEYGFRVVVTVGDLLRSIHGAGLQNYKFHQEGSGCMFWQLHLLEMMVSWEWIKERDVEKVKSEIERARSNSRSVATSMPWPPIKGTFYASQPA